jgi:predicted  nucleic acid-binding Zn-ribbon protein
MLFNETLTAVALSESTKDKKFKKTISKKKKLNQQEKTISALQHLINVSAEELETQMQVLEQKIKELD